MNNKKIHEGDLIAEAGKVYEYTEVSGYVDASRVKSAKEFNEQFPRLTSIGGYLDLSSLTSAQGLKLPRSIGGYLDLGSLTSAQGLKLPQSIGGYLDLRRLTSAQGLKLPQSIGGYLDLGSLTSAERAKITTKQNDERARNSALERCRAMLLSSFAATGYSFADGILARIVSQRGPVSRVVICGETEVSYLVTDGEAWSHGKTLAEAREGLLFKIGKRDTSEFKSWTLNKVVSKRDAIRAYRTITGACEGGVRSWMEQRQTPGKITVQGIIELTKGAYGAEKFKAFFAPDKVLERV